MEETGVVHKYCLILFTTFAMQIIPFMIASSQFIKGIKGTNFLSFLFFSENAIPSILSCEKFYLTSHKVSQRGG